MNQPKRPTPKKNKRKHLPSLDKLQLEAFKARLASVTQISAEGKEAVMLSMLAAANPNAESPEVVIRTLDPEMQQLIAAASQGYQQTFGGIQARGRISLMLDMEIDGLIDSEDE